MTTTDLIPTAAQLDYIEEHPDDPDAMYYELSAVVQ